MGGIGNRHKRAQVLVMTNISDDKIMTNSDARLWCEKQYADDTANEVTPSSEVMEKLDLATSETIEPIQPPRTDIYCPDCEMWPPKKVIVAPIPLSDSINLSIQTYQVSSYDSDRLFGTV